MAENDGLPLEEAATPFHAKIMIDIGGSFRKTGVGRRGGTLHCQGVGVVSYKLRRKLCQPLVKLRITSGIGSTLSSPSSIGIAVVIGGQNPLWEGKIRPKLSSPDAFGRLFLPWRLGLLAPSFTGTDRKRLPEIPVFFLKLIQGYVISE